MNKVKKAFTYAVGATVMAGVGAYLAMPKEVRSNIKGMLGNMMKSNNSNNNDSKSSSSN